MSLAFSSEESSPSSKPISSSSTESSLSSKSISPSSTESSLSSKPISPSSTESSLSSKSISPSSKPISSSSTESSPSSKPISSSSEESSSSSKSISSAFSSDPSFPRKRESSAPISKTTGVTFDKALPEDISNENFPDIITGFDFPDATLFDLVKAIGKHTGINFILNNDLKNKRISIIAPSQITVAEAYKAFLSALSVHGYTLVKTGAFWKIQTTEKSHKDNIEVYSGNYFPNTDQLITRIIKLKHINAKDFVASIKFLLSQSEKIKAHESSNSIIVSDYGSVIEKIMKIVYEMDIPGAEEQIEIIPIDHASVEEVAQILGALLSDKNQKPSGSRLSKSKGRTNVILSIDSKHSSSGQVKVSKIIPDVRTNSLVVSANEAGLKRIKELIKKIDRRVNPSRIGGVYVYHVLHGTAEDVYNTLMGIKSSSSNSSTGGASGRRPYVPSRSRSPQRIGGSSSKLFENVTIMEDTNTNSLIISAAKKYEYERVLEVLKKIDVPRDQVFIQAIILEMKINKNKERSINLAGGLTEQIMSNLKGFLNVIPGSQHLSIDFLAGSVAGFLTDSIGIQDVGKTNFGPGLILNQSLSSILGENLNLTDPEISEGAGDNKVTRKDPTLSNNLKTSFVPLVRLLNNVDNVNVLSTPQITTLDNVQAQITIGSQIPVGLNTTLSGGGLSSTSPQRLDVLLDLQITPRINPQSETIQMKIMQKFDDIGEQNSIPSELRGQAASILKREIKTEMVLQNGETAVLGGLLSDTNSSGKSKVPLLGDIPLLGWLFRGETTKTEKRNLLVFITPTIIKGAHNKQSHRDLLNKKIEERIRFIEKYMGGKDPHRDILDELVPASATVRKQYMENQDIEEDSPLSFFRKKKSLAPAKSKNIPSQDLEDFLEPSSQPFEESFDELEELEAESEEFQEWVETPVEENSEDSSVQENDFTPAIEPNKESDENQEDSKDSSTQMSDFTPAIEPGKDSDEIENLETDSKNSEEDFIPLELEDLN